MSAEFAVGRVGGAGPLMPEVPASLGDQTGQQLPGESEPDRDFRMRSLPCTLRQVSCPIEDLQPRLTHLTDRMVEQLWCHYPQVLQLTDDIGDPRILVFWQKAPMPAKGTRLRKATDAQML